MLKSLPTSRSDNNNNVNYSYLKSALPKVCSTPQAQNKVQLTAHMAALVKYF